MIFHKYVFEFLCIIYYIFPFQIAGKKMYSDRVVDILKYVDENPLNVKSQKMYYGEWFSSLLFQNYYNF